MNTKNKKLIWQKYLTREYTFLYISYAIDCYKVIKKKVGTTITYDISEGNGKLVSLYGISDDIQTSYNLIEKIVAKNPQGFDVELKIVEYGQYLRYEAEHFIKCKLLHWNESSEFIKVVEGIKENKKVTDIDLDKIKQIYSFCNWTTSHVDVGDDHGLAQLKEKISDFVVISDRY